MICINENLSSFEIYGENRFPFTNNIFDRDIIRGKKLIVTGGQCITKYDYFWAVKVYLLIDYRFPIFMVIIGKSSR